MEKKVNKYNDITYGSVAYELEPEVEVQKRRKQKPKPVRKNKNSTKIKLMSFVGITFLCGLLILYRFAAIISLSGEVRSVKNKITTVQNENQDLIVKLAELNSIKYVDKVASEKYGMVIPDKKNTIFIDVKQLNKKAASEEVQQNKGVNKLLGLIR